jgi:ATP-dependent Clp endopeptidase proteolytic subunit ClpP
MPTATLRPILATARQPIYLYDSIGAGLFTEGNTAKSVIDQIKAAGSKPIDLHINSPGGSVFDGYAIYNALLNHKPGLDVYIDGLAASIASYIAMAGGRIVIAANALLMIHNPSSAANDGTAEELRKQADLLDKITDSIVDAYSRRTGLPEQQIAEMLDEETWLDAETAKAFGFVDEITEPLELAASFDTTQLSKFKNVPETLITKITMQTEDSTTKNTETTKDDKKVNPETFGTEGFVSSVVENKPSLFQRVAAIIKEKGTLAEINAKHQTEIEAKDKQISEFGTRNSELTNALADYQARVKAYEAAEKELKDAVDKLSTEAKSAEDRAVDIVASTGFPKNELPAATDAEKEQAAREAAEPKTEKEWMDKYSAIKDPAEQTKFMRENSDKIWACKQAERAANKK